MTWVLTWRGALVSYGVALVVLLGVWAAASAPGRRYERSSAVTEYEARELARQARLAQIHRDRRRNSRGR